MALALLLDAPADMAEAKAKAEAREDRITTRAGESLASSSATAAFRERLHGFPVASTSEPARDGIAGDSEAVASGHGSRLWMRSRGQVQIVDFDDIEWIESELRYCWLHLRSGESRRYRETISRLEKRLDPARFARVHRSVIVNLDSVAEAISSATSKVVVLKNGTRLPISRSRRRCVFGSLTPPR